MTKRRYYVTYLGVQHEVFPVSKGKQKFTWQRERDQIFKRKKLGTALQFTNLNGGSDFDFFSSIELAGESCVEMKLLIQKQCAGAWQDEWNGFFSTGGGKFDFDNCMFEVLPEIDDAYRCFFSVWEEKFNIFDYIVRIVEQGVDTTYESCQSTYICTCGAGAYPACPVGVNGCPSNDFDDYEMPCGGYATEADMIADGWCVVGQWLSGVSGVPDLIQVHKTWWRQLAVVPCILGVCPPMDATWTLLTTDCGGVGCTFVRCPNEITPWADLRGVLWIDTMNEKIKLINKTCFDIDHVSSIFFDFLPDTSDFHYNQYGPGTNYVTQVASQVDNLIVSQKSDIIKPGASNPATIGMTDLKQWLDWAREVFNVYWDIYTDISGNLIFRLEHYSFYQSQQAIDLRLPQYAQYVKRFNRYEHLKDEIPRLEKWKWADALNEDFVGVDIVYPEPCAAFGLEVTHAPEALSTDLGWLRNNADLDLEGFVLLSTKLISNTYIINYEQGLLTNSFLYNGHLSWANLHFNYHRHNRYLSAGNMNNLSESFFSWRPNIKQPKLQIPGCCLDIDPMGYAKTPLGFNIINRVAFIDKMELGFDDILSFELTYSL